MGHPERRHRRPERVEKVALLWGNTPDRWSETVGGGLDAIGVDAVVGRALYADRLTLPEQRSSQNFRLKAEATPLQLRLPLSGPLFPWLLMWLPPSGGSSATAQVSTVWAAEACRHASPAPVEH